MTRQKPVILTRTSVAKSHLFEVERLHLRFSNGEERHFERLRSRGAGAVLVVPMLDDNTVILVNEYAAGFDRYEIGCPKGVIEMDEDPLEAANREMQEEIGFAAKSLQLLHKVTLAPGYLGNQTYIILARDLYPSLLPGDEPEPIETIHWSLNNLDALFAREDFTEARSMLALMMAKNAQVAP